MAVCPPRLSFFSIAHWPRVSPSAASVAAICCPKAVILLRSCSPCFRMMFGCATHAQPMPGQRGAVPSTWSVTYRFLIGAIVMFTYARAIGAPVGLDREGHMFALLFGIPQFCLNFNAVYLAEQYVTSGLVAVVYALLIVP